MSEYHLIDIDDGHRPGGTRKPTKLAVNHKPVSDFVTVFDNILPDIWCQRGYDLAVKRLKPWGVYISSAEAQDTSIDPESLWKSEPTKAIALSAARALMYGRGKGLVEPLLPAVSGTVVWCLTSRVGTNVSYHIDYAELYRYETNIIHPPLIGGVCHLSPFRAGQMEGGHFLVNVGGLDHYQKFGYKGKLSGDAALEQDMSSSGSSGSDWMSIPYRYNRGIMFDGDLPHSSAPVTAIHGEREGEAGMLRVILGLNCFSEAVNECCRRAPEHSDAFNRTIRMYQSMSVCGGLSVSDAADDDDDNEAIADSYKYSNNSSSNSNSSNSNNNNNSANGEQPCQGVKQLQKGKRFTIEEVKSNPFLKKLVLAAAKAKKTATASEPTAALPTPPPSDPSTATAMTGTTDAPQSVSS